MKANYQYIKNRKSNYNQEIKKNIRKLNVCNVVVNTIRKIKCN